MDSTVAPLDDVGVVRGVVARVRRVRLVDFHARVPRSLSCSAMVSSSQVKWGRWPPSCLFLRMPRGCCCCAAILVFGCEAVARAGDVLDGVDCRRVTLGLFPRRDGCSSRC